MKTLPDEIQKQIIALSGKDSTSVTVTIPVVQKQCNRIDRGRFSIAWALHLAMGANSGREHEVQFPALHLRRAFPHLAVEP